MRFPYTDIHKVITDVLNQHNRPIYQFSLRIFEALDFGINKENLKIWIPLMSRNIKYLGILSQSKDKDELPHIVFSCKELTYFKFSSFNLSIPHHFQGFKKLIELHLDSIEVESRALESFMSACPFLEKLIVDGCSSSDDLVISSTFLKVFVLKLIQTKTICLKKQII
ncbi:F-box/FBD/LRR-repeat protein At1g13570-like [Vicia villosa]|uniref:F-box/FBD/LRR-repeat protein At1g13570-like n=1 Tax=Vicia villosa TaxID=3911 RepID=UPI00273C2A1E|nr:F-box/FBD/LRR-repeat protein At1g13570-like [Vicia villosa]